MAGFGPPPKENKRRRNGDTFGTDALPSPLVSASAPPLPTPDRWLAATCVWWATWADSAQSAHFTATDWQRLLALIPLVDSYQRMTAPEHAEDTRKMRAALEILKEIRQNESLLGATHLDRLRGRMTSTAQTKPAEGAGSFDLSAYREMFTE